MRDRDAVCDPEVARELLYILGWINGVQMSMQSTAERLAVARDELERALLQEFQDEVGGNREPVTGGRTGCSDMDVDADAE